MSVNNQGSPVPPLDELVDLFDTQDMGDYWERMPEAQFDIDIQNRTYLVAIDADIANKLVELAREQDISAESLINSWLREKIDQVA